MSDKVRVSRFLAQENLGINPHGVPERDGVIELSEGDILFSIAQSLHKISQNPPQTIFNHNFSPFVPEKPPVSLPESLSKVLKPMKDAPKLNQTVIIGIEQGSLEQVRILWHDGCFRIAYSNGTCGDIVPEGDLMGWIEEAEAYNLPEEDVARGATGLLLKAARQFRYYETCHRAKKTPEADLKANINAMLASEIEHLLASMV